MFGKRDPVCGAKIKNSEHILTYGGKTYYFDCQACKATFEKEPQRFDGRGSNRGFLKWLAKGSSEVPKSCHEIKK